MSLDSKTKRVWIHRIVWVMFAVYIGAMAYFLFFSEELNRDAGSYEYNLELFKEIKRSIWCYNNGMREYFYLNVIMNVAAFMPFGFILPIISSKNRRALNITLLSFELTLTIEILQLLLKVGCFDVDDLLLNTIGGLFGYLLFKVCFRLGRKRRKP